MQSLGNRSPTRSKKGFAKIQRTCAQAISQGLEWAWVDTCCIDKSSSAELSEAINSMFRWYRDSSVCYAYLSDVEYYSQGHPPKLEKSRWFTRGWTLQELIAPRRVHFFCKTWGFLGSRDALREEITKITGIPSGLLEGSSRVNSFSVAQRMSWASKRQTTREEDMAYCLLGLFDIHMPLLYGEGTKAFARLQEEIIKQIDDQSLFAWTKSDPDDPDIWSLRSVLADSPADFAASGNVKVLHEEVGDASTLTKKGLHIHAPLQPMRFSDMTRFHNYGSRNAYSRRGMRPRLFRMWLNCAVQKDYRNQCRIFLWVLIVLPTDKWSYNELDGQTFARVMAPGIHTPHTEDRDAPEFMELTEEFHRIYLTTKPQIHQPFVNGGIYFHGIPIIFDKDLASKLENRAEPLWDEAWCLLSSESSWSLPLPGNNYDISEAPHHLILKSSYRGCYNFHRNPVGSVSAGSWQQGMLERYGWAVMNSFTLVGDPLWSEHPKFICGTIPKEVSQLDSGLLCWFTPPRPHPSWWMGNTTFDRSFLDRSPPPLIYPNGNSGELAIIETLCGGTHIEVLVYREPTSSWPAGLASDNLKAQEPPNFLLLFNSFSESSGLPGTSMLEQYRKFGGFDLVHDHCDVNRDLAELPRMAGCANETNLNYMLKIRRENFMKKDKIGAGSADDSGKLKWCRLYTFGVDEDGRKIPQLAAEQKFDTVDGDVIWSSGISTKAEKQSPLWVIKSR
ncbi:hypothetical protein QBC42DRAFT_262208 [Cladorrhinum samala]|uniref:Heterokaryon incompatibility domain-containing protein n=1 Tax=Cladorrhinum samala TaxID=585594 RepID=A0AAV9HVP1_9PEZI|nr:hypothetical protein QBC42DRAFT_262208 [Cladorrhinum samala]